MCVCVKKPVDLPRKSSVSFGILDEDHHGQRSTFRCQKDGQWQTAIVADAKMCPLSQSRRRLLSQRPQETLPMERVPVYELLVGRRAAKSHGCPGGSQKVNYLNTQISPAHSITNLCVETNKMARLIRQQNSESAKSDGQVKPNQSKVTKSAEAILAQKKLYQKHLRTLQQSSLARDVLQSKTRRHLAYTLCMTERCHPFTSCPFSHAILKQSDSSTTTQAVSS